MNRRIVACLVALTVIGGFLATAAASAQADAAGAGALAFEPVQPADGRAGTDIAAADLNGDGRPDLVDTNKAASSIGVRLGTGDGAFAAETNTATPSPSQMVLADVTNDGKPDVASVNTSAPWISIMRGQGDGTFANGVNTYPFGDLRAFAFGDLNGDGRTDFAGANGGPAGSDFSGLTVWVAQPPNSPDSGRTVYQDIHDPVGVAIGDVNHDSHLDVVAFDATRTGLIVLLGDGTGALTEQPTTFPIGSNVQSLVLADLNGDGVLDVVGTDPAAGNLVVALGNGDGTFGTATHPAVDGADPTKVRVADVNGDGIPDLVSANGTAGSVSVYVGDGSGGFASPVTLDVGAVTVSSVAVADFDGDGKADLAAADDNGMAVLLQAGSRYSVAPTSLSFPTTLLGRTSASQTVTVTSTGTLPLTITNAATTGPDAAAFPIVDDGCAGQTLETADTCVVTIAFSPTEDHPDAARLAINTPSVTNVAPFSLFGDVTNPVALVQVRGGVGDFNFAQTLNQADDQRFQLVNDFASGDASDLVVPPGGVSFGGPDAAAFSIPTTVGDDCNFRATTTLTSTRGACTFTVRFVPTEDRSYQATLIVTSNASNSPTVYPLTGVGTVAIGSVSPTSVTIFGNPNSFIEEQPLYVTNTGDGPLVLGAASTESRGFFLAAGDCPAAILPGRSCTAEIAGQAGSAGTFDETLVIPSNSTPPLPPIQIHEVIQPSSISIDPATEADFSAPVGSSDTESVTVTNPGPGDLSIFSDPMSGPDVSAFVPGPGNTCQRVLVLGGQILHPGQSCQYVIKFSPTEVRTFHAQISIFTSAPTGTAHVVQLVGVGQDVIVPTQSATAIGVTTADGSSQIGDAFTVSTTVAPTLPAAGSPTGLVTVSDGAGHTCSYTLATSDNGAGSCQLTERHVGQYTLSATYAGDDSFLGSTGQAAAAKSVTPALLTITASGGTMSYAGTPRVITPSYAGFITGDDATSLATAPACSTTATATSPVGTYPSSCSGAASPDYTINYAAGAVAVTPVPLTITASSGSMSYGAAPPAITPSYAGFVNSDGPASLNPPVTCATTATSSSGVGTYPSTCKDAADANYTISYPPGVVVVSAAPLMVTAPPVSIAYGSPVPAVAPTYSGFVNGDSPLSLMTPATCQIAYTPTKPVGSYPGAVTCGGGLSWNYTFAYAPGPLTVVKAPTSLSVTPVSILRSLLTVRVTFVARLTTGTAGLAAKTVAFSLGSTRECTAVTGPNGTATCSVSLLSVVFALRAHGSVTADFAGDGTYLASSATVANVLVGPQPL